MGPVKEVDKSYVRVVPVPRSGKQERSAQVLSFHAVYGPDEGVSCGPNVGRIWAKPFLLSGSESERCPSSWNESEFDKPSLFFLLSDTASSTLYFLVPPLQIHTEEEGCNQHVGTRADRPHSLHTHMLFRSAVTLVSALRK
ncbi:hypothetical protein NQZ68_025481 [Dissostichus eleginoides]|nr:hypothetical protein NQZ68_025481 [Dissostichus eleginoides]